MRSCEGSGAGQSALGPAGPDRICCKAGFAKNIGVTKVFEGFWETMTGIRPLPHGNENAPPETHRRLTGTFVFLGFSKVFPYTLLRGARFREAHSGPRWA